MSFFRVCELLSSNEKQDIEEAKRIIKNERLYNTADASEKTLLHHASEIGNHEIVQFLVDSGSEVDACNNRKQTPLVSTLHTRNPCIKVIEILLKAGASIMKRQRFGKNAISIVNSEEWLSEDTKKYEIYKMLLEKTDVFDYFKLLLKGNEKTITMLLQTNIDLGITDSKGITLFHALAQNSNPGIMRWLRGKMIDINVNDSDGWTPLMHAILFRSINSIEFLLDEGANIEATEKEKRSALYIAYQLFLDGKDIKCIQLLLERGANAQIEVDSVAYPTIFDLILENESYIAGNLALAHLALQEVKEDNITQLIYSKINSYNRFKTYFEKCKQQITTKIYRSVTLLDILTASDSKLELYLRDKELASKVAAFEALEYFETILRKRLSRASSMSEMRKSAAPIIGEIIKIDFSSFPSIVEKIVSYLEKRDLECLISI